MNDEARGDALVLMGGSGAVPVPDLPGVFVGHSTGLKIWARPIRHRLYSAPPGPAWRRRPSSTAGGFLRFYNICDPANPVEVSTYATPNTNNEDVALEGTWSVHNPEVEGNTVFASWYSDGLRVLDISKPSAPREIASWTGAAAPADAPPVNLWGVVVHRGLILVSDRNYGLYILELSP
jgi:LVIVD repeat